MPGAATLEAEITNVSPHGFWLFLDGEELHVSFSLFPWFKQATIGQLCAVERPTGDHLYWSELDIDLSVESIKDPTAFPLVSRLGA